VEWSELLNVLHIERDPELIRGEGHEAEENNEYAKAEVLVFPDNGIEKRVLAYMFPESESTEAESTENKQKDGSRIVPSPFWAFSSNMSAK
jgi:hypothetical protein